MADTMGGTMGERDEGRRVAAFAWCEGLVRGSGADVGG